MARRIVIVEDNDSIARYLRFVLEHEGGYEVIETQDGDEAVELAGDPATAAVLMDVTLRSTQCHGRFVDGVELTRIMKADPAARGVPVVLATAHAMAGDRERLLRDSGADAFIVKPVPSVNHLLAILARVERPRPV